VLNNGLRVVVAPDHTAPVVAVAVVYDVGFRSEPEGRTGFAHLFEHLMFQGSAGVAKMEHGSLVQGAGGVFNGHTRPDLTSYYEALPAPALELALFLEADRMASLRLDQENLDNQIAVVQQEIRVNVLNRPYGGFPWIDLPGLAFDSFANSHNGYGSFEDLEGASLDDAAQFYRDYYAPGNAVLVVAGDVELGPTLDLAERYFGPIAPRSTPQRPSFRESPLGSARFEVRHDPQAPSPALAIGLRSPDPAEELSSVLDTVVVAAILGDGEASRLRQRLIHDTHAVTDLACYLGIFGDPLSMRDPGLFQVVLFHPGRLGRDELQEEVSSELKTLSLRGPDHLELERVKTKLVSERWREADRVLERALAMADAEILHSSPELVAEVPAMMAEVDADRVRAAAARLVAQWPVVFEILPGPSEEGGDR
jgi:zinc protease